ncbi:unnamed protein product [Darwinula stevensoni]|uniref:Golgin-84 n=1 Tax=Darwinula stevensoni TaxID=69355 RepID=A0A7R8XEB1_9CRUS|nr:unnamed protein product [Darwinula stevensoni]CAG0894076.1 unnamed protein product [Darwinula stevensoni]
MSWLSGWAEKAEEFLNRVDQGAAQALQTDTGLLSSTFAVPSAPSNYETEKEVGADAQSQPSAPRKNLTPASSVPHNLSSYWDSAHQKSNSSANRKDSPIHRPKPKDDELMEYLNNPDSVNPSAKSESTSTFGESVVDAEVTQEQLLLGAMEQIEMKTDVEEAETLKTNRSGHSGLGEGFQPNWQMSRENETSPPVMDENSLLRSEVNSLNEEMNQLLKRVKDQEQENKKMEKTIELSKSEMKSKQAIIKELEAKSRDMTDALQAKDSQLAVLRVRLQEADSDLKIKEDFLEKLRQENQMIIQASSESSGLHNQALESLQGKVVELEAALEREQSAHRAAQAEAMQRSSQLEEEKAALSATLTEMQGKMKESKEWASELSARLQREKESKEAAQEEYAEYKQKAQRILQSKEKLISSLKEGNKADGSGVDSKEVESLKMELDQIKQERDLLREEIQQTQVTLQQLKTQLYEQETTIQSDAAAAHETQRTLEDSLKDESHKKEELEKECKHLNEEIQYLRDELLKQKTTLSSRIDEREQEIGRLRQQLTAKQLSSSSTTELEARLQSLTESLIQKQTLIETLSTEKNSLTLQLERLEDQVKRDGLFPRPSSSFINMNSTDDAKAQYPSFMIENPFDSGVTRRVKRAYSTLDRFSVRLGRTLRRYPMARTLIIIYMILLHLWVMIVLLTYKPEIHNTNFSPEPIPPKPL